MSILSSLDSQRNLHNHNFVGDMTMSAVIITLWKAQVSSQSVRSRWDLVMHIHSKGRFPQVVEVHNVIIQRSSWYQSAKHKLINTSGFLRALITHLLSMIFTRSISQTQNSSANPGCTRVLITHLLSVCLHILYILNDFCRPCCRRIATAEN